MTVPREYYTDRQDRSDIDDEHFLAEYAQSTTACCPRQTIPDSCSCIDDCQCNCQDCGCWDWRHENDTDTQ